MEKQGNDELMDIVKKLKYTIDELSKMTDSDKDITVNAECRELLSDLKSTTELYLAR